MKRLRSQITLMVGLGSLIVLLAMLLFSSGYSTPQGHDRTAEIVALDRASPQMISNVVVQEHQYCCDCMINREQPSIATIGKEPNAILRQDQDYDMTPAWQRNVDITIVQLIRVQRIPWDRNPELVLLC